MYQISNQSNNFNIVFWVWDKNPTAVAKKVVKGNRVKSVAEKVIKGNRVKSVADKVVKGNRVKSVAEKLVKGNRLKSEPTRAKTVWFK